LFANLLSAEVWERGPAKALVKARHNPQLDQGWFAPHGIARAILDLGRGATSSKTNIARQSRH
jgi:hypothetical protein